ncbi:MAG: copper chaperone PCu(A)C [Ardenticatenaceae bacterium]|nr:copper chaperone PCu(A)C [Anaerolineales bacterium]MCB8984146.1 copper chaperone PCu(A)C [Ardenticatenaceae bacterium]
MKRVSIVLFILLLGVLMGCSSAGTDTAGTLEVKDVWGRNSPMAAPNGAFYMTIVNNTGEDEQLLSVATDVCSTVELHEMYTMDNGAMGMRPVDGGVIAIPAGQTVELKVGGLHVMCIDKVQAFETGQQIPLTLTFANAGEMVVNAEIREEAMDSSSMGG